MCRKLRAHHQVSPGAKEKALVDLHPGWLKTIARILGMHATETARVTQSHATAEVHLDCSRYGSSNDQLAAASDETEQRCCG